MRQNDKYKKLVLIDILIAIFLVVICLLDELLSIMFNIPILNYELVLFIGIAAVSVMTFILLIKLAKRWRYFKIFAYIALSIALCFVMLINYTLYIYISSSKYNQKQFHTIYIKTKANDVLSFAFALKKPHCADAALPKLRGRYDVNINIYILLIHFLCVLCVYFS